PQSILHCLVYYRDGSVITQASMPDMRTPIAYSLGWPERLITNVPRVDLATTSTLTFETPDEVRFPALRLAREALMAAGTAPTVLNAANEVAVEAFLKQRLSFLQITQIVEQTLDIAQQTFSSLTPDNLETVLHIDGAARSLAASLIAKETP